jgi:hypothetical protein
LLVIIAWLSIGIAVACSIWIALDETLTHAAFEPRYWLLMQIAMICGFFTSYPVNRWLIRSGLNETM